MKLYNPDRDCSLSKNEIKNSESKKEIYIKYAKQQS